MAQDSTLLPAESFLPEGLHRPPRILVADADGSIRKLLRFHLRRSGCDVTVVDSGEAALSAVDASAGMDLVLLDLRLDSGGGLDTLRALNASGKVGCVIVMTAGGTMAEAVSALKEGAYDFVNKTRSFDDVRMAIRNAVQTVGLREEVEQLRMQLNERDGRFGDIIGVSRAIEQTIKLARKVADSNITVLIQGESGTGKELVARAIHYEGQARDQPFVAINCAAIPESLLESELFGHEKGAFTGATSRRKGRFEEAHEGTLFLDEIGELSPALQAKLLRVLQTGEIQPIGGAARQVHVRVISATNRDLLHPAPDAYFREDLYYRLAVFPILLPPLRDRAEDIPLLVEHFVERFAAAERKPIRGVEPEAMRRLVLSPWLGNVRELENAIYRAVVLAESSELTLHDFPSLPPVRALHEQRPLSDDPTPPPSAAEQPGTHQPRTIPNAATLEQLEAQAIRAALADNRGNMSRAAVQLNIGRATLYRKSKKYGIHRTQSETVS